MCSDGTKQVLVSAGGRVESFDARTGRRLPSFVPLSTPPPPSDVCSLLLLITYHTAFNHGGAGPVFMTMHDISGGTAHGNDTHDTRVRARTVSDNDWLFTQTVVRRW